MAQTILFSNDSLVISYEEKTGIICMDWKGEQNLETVKLGCNKLIKLLREVNCHKILNDNTHVRGSWSDASEWVATECLPNLKEAGLEYIAWVYSPSKFSQLSTNETLNLNKSVVAVTFQDVEAAKKWLESM